MAMPRRDDAGIALGATVMAVLVISVLLSLMLRQTETLYSETVYRAEDDELLGATEAALDAYVSKYMITSTYPAAYVDQFERTRQCADGTTQVAAGSPNTCATWTYGSTSSDTDWSPISELLTGVDDSIEVAVEVLAGSGGQYEVRVTGRDGGGRKRTVSAVVGGRPLTDFARFVLNTGLDLDEDQWEEEITGHLYAGNGNINGGTGGNPVTVTKDFYASGNISNVTAASGAQGYNSMGNSGYGQFSDVFPTPITAATLWAGIENIKDVACDGTSRGLCLDAAWWQGVVADTDGPSVPPGQTWTAGTSWQDWRAGLGFSELAPDAIMLSIENGAFAISVYQYPQYLSPPELLQDCLQAITEEYWFHRAEPFWFWLQWDKWMNDGGGDNPPNQFGQYWLTLNDVVDIDDFTEGVIWSEYPLIISHNLRDENDDFVNSSLTIAAGDESDPVDVHIWTDLQPHNGKVLGIVASGDIFVDRVGTEYNGSDDFNEFLGRDNRTDLYPDRDSTHYSFPSIPDAYDLTWGNAQRDDDDNWDEELEIRAALLAMGDEGIMIANKCPTSNYNRSSSGGGDDDDGEIEFTGSAATTVDKFFLGGRDWADADEREFEYDSTLQGVQPPYFPLLGGASLVSAWAEQTVPAWAR